jgi:hypothetical protein
MAVTIAGTIKSARAIEVTIKKTGAKSYLLAFDVADEVGNIYPCQMWPDDPQQAALLQSVDNLRRQPVTLTVASYVARMRSMPDGQQRAQVNFIATNVTFPTQP